MIKIIQQRGLGKEVNHIEEEIKGEIIQHTSLKWLDNPTDYTCFTDNSITINKQVFTFPKGEDVKFNRPHEQIINPERDSNGVLHATIIKRYSVEHKHIFEAEDCDCSFNPPRDNTEQEVIAATIYIESTEIKIIKELQEIETEIKSMEDNALQSLILDRLNEEI